MTSKQKIDMILRWAEENPDFNTGFAMDLQGSLKKWGKLTPKQDKALDNIIKGFNIDGSNPPAKDELDFATGDEADIHYPDDDFDDDIPF